MTQTLESPETIYKVIGTRPIRQDGLDKVTGRARYSADFALPGMGWGKILRSPHAHARILSIDTSKAEAHPGVYAVVTAKDMPAVSGRLADQPEAALQNLGFMSWNILARDKVLYQGHAIAGVAAVSAFVAEEALSLIDVQYEVLPPVMSGLDAMKPGAAILIEDLAPESNPGRRAGGLRNPDQPRQQTNIANHFVFEQGDVATGFEDADIIVEREYDTGIVHQGYIEPQSCTAQWTEDGHLTIWLSTQGHFGAREYVSGVLGLPVSQIRIVPLEIGGGFGAKTVVYAEPVAAMLARKAHRPIKISLNRTEVFLATGPTSATNIRVKVGVTNEGRITAADAKLVFEAGCFPGSPVIPGSTYMFGCYEVPNMRAEGFDVLVNKPKVAAYRAPGTPSAAFALETVMDEIAEKLGMDPIELRLKNAAKEGTRRVTGVPYPRIGYVECLEAAKNSDHWQTPLTGPNRGRGIATGCWGNGSGPASVVASVNADGVISLVEGSPDIGGSRAVVAMCLAEVLGIPAEEVRPSIGDTDSIGYTSTTGGSSVAFKSGYAAYEAGQDIKRQAIARAAKIWSVTAEDVVYEDGAMTNAKDPSKRMTFKELARRLNATGGPIIGRATVSPGGQGTSFAIHIADVEVDPDTGKTQILRYTTIQDAGRAIHPSYVEGQMQGGASQGIGWALNEEYVYNDKGSLMNASFLDYRMPTSLDVPMLDTIIVEVPAPSHPYGVRGTGEVGIVPPMATLANAIAAATGVRLHHLPMSPAIVLEALAAKANGG